MTSLEQELFSTLGALTSLYGGERARSRAMSRDEAVRIAESLPVS